jgi:hypothetical protein
VWRIADSGKINNSLHTGCFGGCSVGGADLDLRPNRVDKSGFRLDAKCCRKRQLFKGQRVKTTKWITIWSMVMIGLTVTAWVVLRSASGVYRPLGSKDDIRFYVRAQELGTRNGVFYAKGYECGVIGDNGKEIGIALVSTTVNDGQIKTKDFGILKMVMLHDSTVTLLATESQVKKLHELQSSYRSVWPPSR